MLRECPVDPRDVPCGRSLGGHPRRSVVHQPHNLVDITRAGDPNVRRLLAVHSLPRRGMNRRLIVQFDPDEPSMSAPTFAEPDRGPLAGGRKVNARHDLTLDALASRLRNFARVSEKVIALRRSPGAWVRT